MGPGPDPNEEKRLDKKTGRRRLGGQQPETEAPSEPIRAELSKRSEKIKISTAKPWAFIDLCDLRCVSLYKLGIRSQYRLFVPSSLGASLGPCCNLAPRFL